MSTVLAGPGEQPRLILLVMGIVAPWLILNSLRLIWEMNRSAL